MKTKDLIKTLQELDPSGEMDVVSESNESIHYLECLPAAYNGTLEDIEFSDSCRKPLKGRYNRKGYKIKINFISIDDAVMYNPDDFEVDYSELSEHFQNKEREKHDKIREESRRIVKDIHIEYFVKWVLSRNSDADLEKIMEFAEEHITHEDEPVYPLPLGKSYYDLTLEYWDKKYGNQLKEFIR